jgi:hypothetical protein
VAPATGLSRRARAARTHELDVPAEFESIKSPEELHSRVGEHLEVGSFDALEQQQIHEGRTLPLARVQAVFQARLGEWLPEGMAPFAPRGWGRRRFCRRNMPDDHLSGALREFAAKCLR